MVSQKVYKKKRNSKDIYLLLHNIRSVYNVGSIFRTSDAISIKKIYISGCTPAPIDRFGRKRKDFAKVSLGAENTVHWENISDINIFLKKVKEDGIKIFGLEQDEHSIDYRKAKLNKKNLIILGNEVNGIDRGILNICDSILEIPMLGNKESLNVSVATGILLYSLL